MLINGSNKFKRYLKFKCRLLFIAESASRQGIDPIPRHFLQPETPNGVTEFKSWTKNPSSVKYGYARDEASGLYLKNIKTIDTEGVDGLYAYVLSSPPYWFTSAETFQSWAMINFDAATQGRYAARYNLAKSGGDEISGPKIENRNIPEHKYVMVEETIALVDSNTTYRANWPSTSQINVFNL